MKYDTTLKALLRESPPVALRLIADQGAVQWSSTELPQVRNLHPDLLGETNDGRLLQLEIQQRNDADMPLRMLEYAVAITKTYRRALLQVVLFVGSEKLTMPASYEWEFGSVRYGLMDIRDLDGEVLLASSEPGDNILALLARLKDRSKAVAAVVKKLLQLDKEQSSAYARALLVLAGLRPGLAAEVEQTMTFEFDPAILENEVLGPIYRKGSQEASQDLLSDQVEHRFGPLLEPERQRVRQAVLSLSPAELKKAALRVLDVSSLDELFPRQ